MKSKLHLYFAVFVVALFPALSEGSWAQSTRSTTDPSQTNSGASAKSKQNQSAAAADSSTPVAPATKPATASSATSPPKATPATNPQTAPPANSSGMVWVNTESGVYHKPGTRYYGKTKQGKYMLETDAIRAGYHAAGKH
jgi:hypothetical protein